MKSFLLLALVLSSSALFAQEECNVGLRCETSNGAYIVRETRVIQDESLDLCSTVTIVNFGDDQEACLITAKELSQK